MLVSLKSEKILGGIWPIVQRELRGGARRPFNYWLRVGAASAGLLMVFYIMTGNRHETDRVMGQYLFTGLHGVLMGLICLVVPLMTADCVAREKREGTLGLLFLTPMTAGGIVAGKGLAQALRALTLWVSVAPVLTIPFIMGGIDWADASAFLALEFSALMLCLAAGLLASTLVKGLTAVYVLAVFLGLAFVAVFCLLACFCFLSRTPLIAEWPVGYALLLSGLPLEMVEDYVVARGSVPAPAVMSGLWHQILWFSPLAAVLLFVLVVSFAAWRLAGSWQDKTRSLRQENLVKRYCTPLFKGWFARRMGRVLERNPMVWLQQYSWKPRVVKWGLCLAFVLIATVLMRGNIHPYHYGVTVEPFLFLTIAAGMTFAGINSFAEEKRSGALEMILVTPVPINQIIFGRVRGAWGQYLPAALILASFDAGVHWISGEMKFNRPVGFWGYESLTHYLVSRLPYLCVFLTLPVIALYSALRVKNQIVAAGMTWAALLLPPLLVMLWGQFVISSNNIPDTWISAGFALADLAAGLAACFLLRRRLTRRLYSF
jgi:ABC-type Na+ efflux pump permease subunit